MRRLVAMTVVALVGLLARPAMAQEKMKPEQMAEKRVERLDKQLDLTDDQEQKIKSLLMDEADARKGDREKQKQMQQERKARRDKMDAEMKKILKPEQYSKMLAMRQQKADSMMKQGMAKRLEHMRTSLALTEAQTKKVQSAMEDRMKNMKELDRKYEGSEDVRKEKAKEEHKKYKDKLKSILTDEQMKKLQEEHNGRVKQRK